LTQVGKKGVGLGGFGKIVPKARGSGREGELLRKKKAFFQVENGAEKKKKRLENSKLQLIEGWTVGGNTAEQNLQRRQS